MSFMTWIVNRLNVASDLFYELYLDAYYIGWPVDALGSWFYYLSTTFNSLAWNFSDFGTWVNDTAGKVAEILDWSSIWSLLLAYFPWLEDIGDWYYNWWNNVISAVNAWWSSTQWTVQGWISVAVQVVQDQVNSVNTLLTSLQADVAGLLADLPKIDAVLAWFSNWTGELLTIVNSWWAGALLEVQGLINSAFVVREPFWAGWQDWRDKVTEFFTDPEAQVFKIMERAIERFW